MALPPSFLDELRARTPMPGLVGRRVRLSKSGRNWKGLCPFHNEKSPSFYVYDDSFHCFGCGAHGDAFAYVMRAEGGGFMEAVERLAGEAGMDVPKPSPEAAARERRARDLHGVLQAVEAAYTRRLHAPEGAEALAYLRRRGLTDETIGKFGLGWSGAGRGALAAELREEGIQQDQLVEAGLMQEREEGRAVDLFFNRVMFPIRDRRGRSVSFGGRILGDGQPKYVNGPETALFSKRRNLYGLDLAREGVFRGARLIVTEGYMDVIALHQAGFTGAVAPLGTALTEEQMKALWQVSPEPVLCFDGDAAGSRAAARAAELALPMLSSERTLRFMSLPAGEDPDTLIRGEGVTAFQARLDAADVLEVGVFKVFKSGISVWNAANDAKFERDLQDYAAKIGDKYYGKQIRRIFNELFWEDIKKRKSAGKKNVRQQKGVIYDKMMEEFRPKLVALASGSGAVRLTQNERERILLAICVRHPEIISEVDEALLKLDFKNGLAVQVRNALSAWFRAGGRLDSGELIDHLASTEAAFATQWVLGAGALPRAAEVDAQPKEVVDAFWHYFGFLRGEAELAEDARAARMAFAETNDPAAQTRLIRLTEALDALRRGEAEAEPSETNF